VNPWDEIYQKPTTPPFPWDERYEQLPSPAAQFDGPLVDKITANVQRKFDSGSGFQDGNQTVIAPAPPRNILQRGADYIIDKAEPRPVKLGGQPMNAVDFLTMSPVTAAVDEYINPFIERHIAPNHPKTAGVLQGVSSAVAGFATPLGVGMVGGLGALGRAVEAGNSLALLARPVAEGVLGVSVGLEAVRNTSAAADAFVRGEDQEAARLLTHSGVSVVIASGIIGGLRRRYKSAKTAVDARNKIVEELRATVAKNVTSEASIRASARPDSVVLRADQRAVGGLPKLTTPSSTAAPTLISSMQQNQPGASLNSVRDLTQEMRGLVDLANSKSNENRIVRISPVDLITQIEAYKNAGLHLLGYAHTADMFSVRHSFNRHGDVATERARGQIAINKEDIAAIPEAVTNPDAVIYGAKNERGQDIVAPVKALSDGSMLVIEEVRTGRKTLSLSSVRKYPAASDIGKIAQTMRFNVRNDGGDIKIVHRNNGAGQQTFLQPREIAQQKLSTESGAVSSDLLGIPQTTGKISDLFSSAKDGGDVAKAVGYVFRPADHILMRSGDVNAAEIADLINAAQHGKSRDLVKYQKAANDAMGGIVRGSVEDKSVVALLDFAQTGLRPENVGKAFELNKLQELRVVRAAADMRKHFFDPLINAVRDPELSKIIGRRGYISGYFPHQVNKMNTLVDIPGLLEDMPKRFISRFLKPREGNEFDLSGISAYDLIDPYSKSMLRTIHDLPAIKRSKNLASLIDDKMLRATAEWYIGNYSGLSSGMNRTLESFGPAGEGAQKFLRGLAQVHYDNLIGLSPKTWAINLTQTITNTWPELNTRFTIAGLKRLFTSEGRDLLRQEGIIEEASSSFDADIKGKVRGFLHFGMKHTEVVNRGIAYLGATEKGKAQGLTGEALRKFANRVVDDTQFNYGRAGDMRGVRSLTPDLRTFKQYWLKETNFVGEKFVDFGKVLFDAWTAKKFGRLKDPAVGRFGRMFFAWAFMASVLGEPVTDSIRGGLGLYGSGGLLGRTGDLIARFFKVIVDGIDGKKSFHDIGSDVLDGIMNVLPAGRNIRLFSHGGVTKVLPGGKYLEKSQDQQFGPRRMPPVRQLPSQQTLPQRPLPDRQASGD